MARSSLQKLKILYVMDYLLHSTDEEHPASIEQLAAYLEQHGISAQRKSLYDDIEALRVFGLDIVKTNRGRHYGYYAASREFELPELKLLVDSVQSSKFITHKKTLTLIKKIEKLASVYEAQQLQRQVYVHNRIKTMNESIYYNVDAIHNGISRGVKIRFKYFDITVEKKRSYRKNGEFYTVSPYALTWDDQNYYMVAFDSEAGMIKHYRVDKMSDIAETDEPRDGWEAYKALDMAAYSKMIFGMFSGEPEPVRMRFDERLAGAVLDKLGQDVIFMRDGDGYFRVTANVVASPQFFAWIFGLGEQAQILGPAEVARRMKSHTEAVLRLYGQEK
ncbi:MAG: WYL domain-containing protein [Clostridia bacterium]|nr:WYL domain-containing protein [Clostridia bacterium]